MLEKLDGAEDAIAYLEKAVEAKGADYVYPFTYNGRNGQRDVCRYMLPNGKPGCIVGYVAAELGDLDELSSRLEGQGIWGLPELPEEVADVLYAAQALQDAGTTWGEALEAAKARANYIIEDREIANV